MSVQLLVIKQQPLPLLTALSSFSKSIPWPASGCRQNVFKRFGRVASPLQIQVFSPLVVHRRLAHQIPR